MRADDNSPEANDDSPENLNIAQKSDASDPGREIMHDKAEGARENRELPYFQIALTLRLDQAALNPQVLGRRLLAVYSSAAAFI
jgi:hypothetical protein